MDKGKNLTLQINLDGRLLLVLLILVGGLFWAYTRAGAQNQTGSDALNTNNPAAQPIAQPALALPLVTPQTAPPEPGMLPDTNRGWIKPEELGSGFTGLVPPNSIAAAPTYPRHFYLTASSFSCNQVLTACVAGYHTASLWEILDVTSLIYDYDLPAAQKFDDSGWGPPSNWNGWVRTGWYSNASNMAGTGNCSNWSTVSNTAYGVSVRLSNTWEFAPGDINTWNATAYSCNFSGPVWCVLN